MQPASRKYLKLTALLLLLALTLFSMLLDTSRYELKNTFNQFYRILNGTRIIDIFMSSSNTTTAPTPNSNTTPPNFPPTIRHSSTTPTTGRPTTLDPALLLVERAPSASPLNKNNTSKSTLAVFLFQTEHHVLANLQLYMIRRLAADLVAVEVFVDGSPSENMRHIAKSHQAQLHAFPVEKHKPGAGGSDRNTAVVNWALALRAKHYLGNGTAILLLDGDVFPLSPFDSSTLLNSRDVVCRKHPALFARFCWIGFICLGPELYSTIDHFDVSQTLRHQQAYDSGGKTIEFFLRYENVSFSWMRETIFLGPDKDLFWGAVDGDIGWIKQNFSPCDKCGPEIFVSPFNVSSAVFYHMISATSEWRFGHQAPRRQAIHDAIMRSPYGPNRTYSSTDMISSVGKVQKMESIPFSGNLTCEKVCRG